MATKTRVKKVDPSTADIAPDLKVRDPNMKYTGDEPKFPVQPLPEVRQLAIIRALSWYHNYCDRKQAKEMLLTLAEERGVTPTDLKRMRTVHEREYDLTLAWLARISQRGLQLNEAELARIGNHLLDILRIATEKELPAQVAEVKSTRPNIQDIMRERSDLAGGEIEGLFDDYTTGVATGAPGVVGILTSHGVMAQHVQPLIDAWRNRKAEYEEALLGKDAQLKEGYSHYNKTRLKGIVKYCDEVIAGLGSYVTAKKAAKAPRKRKAVSPEKQAAKVKYLKAFKDADTKLDLTSISPAKIIGATEVFAYDTARRRLHYYVADSLSVTLSIKGSTICGFDAMKSGVKTVRKPGVILPLLVKGGKPATRKVFTDLTTMATPPTGRTNPDLLILKAW